MMDLIFQVYAIENRGYFPLYWTYYHFIFKIEKKKLAKEKKTNTRVIEQEEGNK